MTGVIVMKVLPAFIIFLFLILYLFFSLKKIYSKAWDLHKKEEKKLKKLILLEMTVKSETVKKKTRKLSSENQTPFMTLF